MASPWANIWCAALAGEVALASEGTLGPGEPVPEVLLSRLPKRRWIIPSHLSARGTVGSKPPCSLSPDRCGDERAVSGRAHGRCQFAQAGQGLGLGGCAAGQLVHFLLPGAFEQLVQNRACFFPTRLNASGYLRQLAGGIAFLRVVAQTFAQGRPGLRAMLLDLGFQPGKQGAVGGGAARTRGRARHR